MNEAEERFGLMLSSLQDDSFVSKSQVSLQADISMLSMATLASATQGGFGKEPPSDSVLPEQNEFLYVEEDIVRLKPGYIHFHLMNLLWKLKAPNLQANGKLNWGWGNLKVSIRRGLFKQKVEAGRFAIKLFQKIESDFALGSLADAPDRLVLDTCIVFSSMISQGTLDPSLSTCAFCLMDYACRFVPLSPRDRIRLHKSMLQLDSQEMACRSFAPGVPLVPRTELRRALVMLADRIHQYNDDGSFIALIRSNYTSLVKSQSLQQEQFAFLLFSLQGLIKLEKWGFEKRLSLEQVDKDTGKSSSTSVMLQKRSQIVRDAVDSLPEGRFMPHGLSNILKELLSIDLSCCPVLTIQRARLLLSLDPLTRKVLPLISELTELMSRNYTEEELEEVTTMDPRKATGEGSLLRIIIANRRYFISESSIVDSREPEETVAISQASPKLDLFIRILLE